MKSVQVSWRPGTTRFVAHGASGATVAVAAPDEPEGITLDGGPHRRQVGPGPAGLLLVAAGTCAAWDVVGTMRWARQEVTGIESRSTASRRPRRPGPSAGSSQASPSADSGSILRGSNGRWPCPWSVLLGPVDDRGGGHDRGHRDGRGRAGLRLSLAPGNAGVTVTASTPSERIWWALFLATDGLLPPVRVGHGPRHGRHLRDGTDRLRVTATRVAGLVSRPAATGRASAMRPASPRRPVSPRPPASPRSPGTATRRRRGSRRAWPAGHRGVERPAGARSR